MGDINNTDKYELMVEEGFRRVSIYSNRCGVRALLRQ